jgi:hypothetical protein
MVASKTAKHVMIRTHLARYTVVKDLDSFELNYPALDRGRGKDAVEEGSSARPSGGGTPRQNRPVRASRGARSPI